MTLAGSAQQDRCPRPPQIRTIARRVFQAPDFQASVAFSDRLDPIPPFLVGDNGRQVEQEGEVVAQLRLIGFGDHEVEAFKGYHQMT